MSVNFTEMSWQQCDTGLFCKIYIFSTGLVTDIQITGNYAGCVNFAYTDYRTSFTNLLYDFGFGCRRHIALRFVLCGHVCLSICVSWSLIVNFYSLRNARTYFNQTRDGYLLSTRSTLHGWHIHGHGRLLATDMSAGDQVSSFPSFIWLTEVWRCLCWLTVKLSAREVQHNLCFFVKCPRNCCLVMVSLKSLLFK